MPDPAIQKGFTCVWGIGTQSIYAGLGVLLPLEEEVLTTRENEPAFDKVDSSVVAETFWRKQSVVRIRLYPGGATITGAIQANSFYFEPGVEMELIDTTDPETIGGFWVVVEQGKTRHFDGKAYWDLTLRRHGNNRVRNTSQRLSVTVTA